MKTYNVAAAVAPSSMTVDPVPTPAVPTDLMPLPVPKDGFEPIQIKPGQFDDIVYGFKVNRMGKEDLEAEKAEQQARAKEAIAQRPPDLKTYLDATSKVNQIEKEQGSRAMEQRGYELGLKFKTDDGLEKALDKAQAELDAVNANPLSSEADRERARARVAAVIEEMDRRD